MPVTFLRLVLLRHNILYDSKNLSRVPRPYFPRFSSAHLPRTHARLQKIRAGSRDYMGDWFSFSSFWSFLASMLCTCISMYQDSSVAVVKSNYMYSIQVYYSTRVLTTEDVHIHMYMYMHVHVCVLQLYKSTCTCCCKNFSKRVKLCCIYTDFFSKPWGCCFNMCTVH